MQILYITISCLFGMCVVYLILRPKLQTIKKLDEQIEKENNKLAEINNHLKISKLDLDNECARLTNKKNDLFAEIDRVNESLDIARSQAENAANLVYEKTIETMQEKLSNAANQESEKFETAKEEYQEQYLQLLEDTTGSYNIVINEYQNQINELNNKLEDLKSKTSAAVEAHKRAQELKDKQDFFKLHLTDIDIIEIEKLRSVTPYLRDSEPLNKVIWKVYYENAYTDLIGRVVGKGVHTGIYKITNLKNNMCYVGQAVDISNRWKQHIKRGIGAETPTRNKLYPAMLEFGVENFSFEIIEKCTKEQLNEREQYWQDYFKAKEFGYSIK